MSNSSVPRKGDLIINPSTSRPIKVGGRSWLKLVKEGVVSGHYTDPKKLGKLPDNEEEAEKEIQRINKTLPRGVQSVRGRGKYKGQITTRNIKPDTEDVSRYTAQMASRIVNDNIDSLADCDDIEAELEKLILQEMAGGRPKKTSKKKVGRPRKTQEEKYVLEEAPMYDFDNQNNTGDEPEQYEEDEEDEEEFIEEPQHIDQEDNSFFGDGDEDDIDYFGDE